MLRGFWGMDRRIFFKFSALLSLMAFCNQNNKISSLDDGVVIVGGWILKKSDLI